MNKIFTEKVSISNQDEFVNKIPIDSKAVEIYYSNSNKKKKLDLKSFVNLTHVKLECKNDLQYSIKRSIHDYSRYINITNNNIDSIYNILSLKSTHIEYLNCSKANIYRIDDLPANLEVLKFNENIISELPELPQTLIQIEFIKNNIYELKKLHKLNNLKILKCSYNPLKNEGLNLYNISANICHLEMSNCGLTNIYFIKYLKNLEILKINANQITETLDFDPNKKLKILECVSNKISNITNLPDCLEILKCSLNQISNLNNLPSGLKILICSNNLIKNLDNLPFGLETLICCHNQITNLDNLPCCLKKLEIQHNQIKSLDNLPSSIKDLIISDNPISQLDNLPSSIKNLSIKNNPIKQLDNLPIQLTKLSICGDTNIKKLSNLPNSTEEIKILNKYKTGKEKIEIELDKDKNSNIKIIKDYKI